MNSKYISRFNTGLSILVCFMAFLTLSSCEKDQHVKPVTGPFAVTSTIPATVPSAGATYTLTIDGSTNGWWIDVANNVSWVTIARKFGSSKATQDVEIGANSSNEDRVVAITVHSTGGQKEIIEIKQSK